MDYMCTSGDTARSLRWLCVWADLGDYWKLDSEDSWLFGGIKYWSSGGKVSRMESTCCSGPIFACTEAKTASGNTLREYSLFGVMLCVFTLFCLFFVCEQAMCVIRVAPIPLGVKNYGLSLVHFPNDNYPFVKYFWSCFLVGLPFSVMWGMTGHGASSLVEIVSRYA
jgi:hypothetical protein